MDNHLNSLGSIQPLTRNLAPRLTNLPSQVPIFSWVERSNAAWSALLRGTTSSRTGRVLNPGLDLDPNPESCTLPLDQLAAKSASPAHGQSILKPSIVPEYQTCTALHITLCHIYRPLETNWLVASSIENSGVLCKSQYQGQAQVIAFHRYCGM